MDLKDKVGHFFAFKKSTSGKELIIILTLGGFLVAFAIYSTVDYVWNGLT